MTPTSRPLHQSRRAFLRTCAGGAAALSGLGMALPAQAATMRVGVLLPQQTHVPQLHEQLLAGASIATTNAQPLWYRNAREARAHIRAAAESGQFDALIGLVSYNYLELVGPHLEQANLPLIVTDIGGSIPRPAAVSPAIFRHSRNHWQAAWALGQWAAQQGNRRALIASSSYDAGYDTVYAFWSGFESAGGDRPELLITDREGTFDAATFHGRIRDLRPDVVFGVASGNRASDLLQAYSKGGWAGRIPLLGTELLAPHNPALLHHFGGDGLRIAQRDTESSAFGEAYRAHTGSAAAPLAVLGYEAVQLIGAAQQRGPLPTALAQVRTPYAFDSLTHTTSGPIIMQSVTARDAQLVYRRVANLTNLALRPLPLPEVPSGVTTPYLAV